MNQPRLFIDIHYDAPMVLSQLNIVTIKLAKCQALVKRVPQLYRILQACFSRGFFLLFGLKVLGKVWFQGCLAK